MWMPFKDRVKEEGPSLRPQANGGWGVWAHEAQPETQQQIRNVTGIKSSVELDFVIDAPRSVISSG